MEIGVFTILVLIAFAILWVENTKTGSRFIYWISMLLNIDLNELED